MRVVIVGAGEVGRTIAHNLEQSHDVVVIDRDPTIIEEVTYSHDVLAIQGDGTERTTLVEAGVERADLVIACTDHDEANVVICGTAKTVSDAFTIARVRQRTLLETWEGSQGAFGVDFMVCTDLLTARAITRITDLPATQDVDTFVGGLVRMAEFEIDAESPVAGSTVHEADQYDSLTFAGVFREEELIVATGETVLQAGDRVVVIGSSSSVTEFARDIVPAMADNGNEIVIVGASEIGFQAAREFEEHGYQPRLIEQDHDRARTVAEKLPNTMVLESDATDVEFLAREHIDEPIWSLRRSTATRRTCWCRCLRADSVSVEPLPLSRTSSMPNCSKPSASTWRSIRVRKLPKRSSGLPALITRRKSRCSNTTGQRSSNSRSPARVCLLVRRLLRP